KGADAYFQYVNSKGGVFGRKIVYKYEDDQFQVAKTIQLTRELVEQDNVLAIFNSVGTEHALAIRPYLNDRKVPQLFVGSVDSFRLGWHPHIYVTSVSISPDIMNIARSSTSQKQVDGSISIAFVKDPTSQRWARDKTVRLYRSIVQRFLPGAKPDDVFNYYG